jgi:hypothetical protein
MGAGAGAEAGVVVVAAAAAVAVAVVGRAAAQEGCKVALGKCERVRESLPMGDSPSPRRTVT